MKKRLNSSATTVNTNRLGATKKGDVDTVDTSANKSHSARAGKTLRNGCQHRQHCQRRASFRRRRKRGGLGFNYTEAMLLIDPATAARIGIGNGRETTRSRRVQLQFDWSKRDSGEWCEATPIPRRASTRLNKARGAAL